MSTSTLGRPDLEFDLADRLRKSLRVSGKAVQSIADDLGAHRNTVANYLSGRSRPERSVLAGWALATGVPISWLETGKLGPDGGPGEGASPKISAGSVPAIRGGIAKVTGVDIDMITFALIAEALGSNDHRLLARHGFTAWLIATASGFDERAAELPTGAVPTYVDENRLAKELREAVEECTRRDSNPKPSDPKVRVLRMLQDSSREAA